MAAPPARADADPSPTSPPTARDTPGRQAEKSETACEDRNAESLDRLLPPVGTGRSPRKRTTSQCKSEPPLLRTSKRTIYTAGRPPWYNEHGTQSKEAFAIGLGGGSASGKTTVARMIIEALDVPWVVLLSMDSFYKLLHSLPHQVLTEQQQEQAAHNNFNFDHPDAFDFDLIISTLKKLKQGKSVKVPIYDFTTHSRKKDWKTLYGANVIIFEGIMAFADKTLLELLDMKIFVDTDSDIRLVRRLRRDISERGRDIEGVIKQYNKFVKPSFDQYIQPTMRLADIVVPRGSGNTVAIDLIVQHVHSQLEERELSVSRGSYVGICEQCAPWCCCVTRLPVAPCPAAPARPSFLLLPRLSLPLPRLFSALPHPIPGPASFPAAAPPLFCPATPHSRPRLFPCRCHASFLPCHTPFPAPPLSLPLPRLFSALPHPIPGPASFPAAATPLFCPATPHSRPRLFPCRCHASFLPCHTPFPAPPLSLPLPRLFSALPHPIPGPASFPAAATPLFCPATPHSRPRLFPCRCHASFLPCHTPFPAPPLSLPLPRLFSALPHPIPGPASFPAAATPLFCPATPHSRPRLFPCRCHASFLPCHTPFLAPPLSLPLPRLFSALPHPIPCPASFLPLPHPILCPVAFLFLPPHHPLSCPAPFPAPVMPLSGFASSRSHLFLASAPLFSCPLLDLLLPRPSPGLGSGAGRGSQETLSQLCPPPPSLERGRAPPRGGARAGPDPTKL
ncbi:uridine-cytidine kinase-like 1 isoform X2 [Pan paniscus]|uniref:uridine-cytidine kinase-like 1 isoform X2 n=1 Tax=Pan paniscus TaxID=9597 RepID=UPI0030048443